jgi:hypothetical protein
MKTHDETKFLSNWTHYHGFLKKQDALLADVFTHYQGQKPKHEYVRVLSGLLHRYAMNFRGVYRIWEDFRKNAHFKFSVYCLLRPLVADYLLMLYLLEEFKFGVPTSDNSSEWKVIEDDFVKRYEGITSLFFERVNSNLKKKVKKGELSAQEMNEILTLHRKEFPEHFEPGPKIKVVKNGGLSPGQLIDKIVKGKQFVKDLYDYYFRLSQFEHFNFITEGLMNDVDRNWEMIHVKEVTDYLLESLAINISTMRVPQEFKERAIILINEFRSTEWQYNKEPGA